MLFYQSHRLGSTVVLAFLYFGLTFLGPTKADPLVIKLDVRANAQLGEYLAQSEHVNVDLWLTTPTGQVVYRDQIELESDRNGRLYGDKKLLEAPDLATALCFRFTTPEIQRSLLLFETCEPIQLAGAGNQQYRTSRALTTPQEYSRLKRNRIIDVLDNRTSSDKALAAADEMVYNFFSGTPAGDLTIHESRLISHLIEAALRVGTRIPTPEYFQIGTGVDNPVVNAIVQMVENDRNVDGNSNSAKVLFQAYQKIDVSMYSAGRPTFLQDFFGSLEFLAINRARIARENGVSGATVAREFSTYCKDLTHVEAKRICVETIDRNSEILFAEAAAAGPRSDARDLSVAAQYQVEALLQLDAATPAPEADPATAAGNAKAAKFLDQYESEVCSGSSKCIKRISAGVFR